ncbi:peptidase inhibitor family I36 protein [Streptomyces litchfieldiae]|uniref:Peptidase inhibitor family I36 protein n=1 Tax=Streptomyces litchfieldiae TaxID=3075543 RepID=A0ABU2ML37_9ACTN|nr:peptidase inhibitor family I36 protein [Streptomyces sp. DSM 44938]MDT0342322.1 peptidase inhibitor family I36 protein [Streptomyces sp. DSM 44938]
MSLRHHIRGAVSVVASLAALLFGAGLATAPGAAAAYADCSSGAICFFSEKDGGGSRCQYYNDTPRTSCDFMNDGRTTWSVYNRSAVRVHYYMDANYGRRIGSTLSGVSGNLSGSYTVGSVCFEDSGSSCPR